MEEILYWRTSFGFTFRIIFALPRIEADSMSVSSYVV
jgi:hypothetical protein